MPNRIFQSGDKGKSLATIIFTGPNQTRDIDIPAPKPGHMYNNLCLVMDATLTATDGTAQGSGANLVIDSLDLEVENISWPVENVRWVTMWVDGYAVAGFLPIAIVSAGAGGGASKSTIFIPCALRPDMGRITLRIRTGALATYHDTATAVAGTVQVYADEVPLGSKQNNRSIAYREKRVNVLDADTDLAFDPQVVPNHGINKAVTYKQETTGTLVDGWLDMDFILKGRYVVQPNFAFDDSQDLMRFDYRRDAAIAGVTIHDWVPEQNSAADLFTLTNDGAGSVKESAILFHYLELGA